MFKINLEVVRKIKINTPQSEVYQYISNLGNWNKWSPWISMDPETKTKTSGSANSKNHKHEWESELIGSGQMTIQSLVGNSLININLEFFKPWKSNSEVRFSIDKIQDNQCEVTWLMKGSLPFFLFFMRKSMIGFISADFNRGLMMLKDLLEKKELLSHTNLIGQTEKASFFSIGIKRQCAMSNLSHHMTEDFNELKKLLDTGIFPKPLNLISITNNWDVINQKVDYVAAITYNEKDHRHDFLNEFLKNNPHYEAKNVGSHKAISAIHLGSYNHLGNAWTRIINYSRIKKIKTNSKIPFYEIYLNDPTSVPEREYKTEVVLPIS